MKKILVAVLALGSVLAVSAADAPAPVAVVTPNEPAATSNCIVKVHSGCKPKRTSKRGGGANIKHRCRTKQIQEAPKP